MHDITYTSKRVERLIAVKIIYAIYYKLTNNIDNAIEKLIDALEHAAPENLVIFFLHNIGEIKDLLTIIFKKPAFIEKVPPQFIENIKIAIERKEKLKKSSADAMLSARELDTLRLISKDLTNQEIADKLFISLNTVKTHVKNILLKSDVEKRTQAISNAKEMGII